VAVLEAIAGTVKASPMQCLTRYVVGQVLAKFLATAFALSLLLLLVGAAKEAISESLGIGHFLRLIPFILPNALLFAVPGALLFAVCQTYGRMASDNEFVALEAVGIHPLALMWPALVVAAVLSLMTVWLNDVAVSWGYRGAQKLIIEAIEDIAYRTITLRHSFSTRSFSVHVARVDGKKLLDATFTFEPRGDSPGGTVSAVQAELRSNPDKGVLELRFNNPQIDVGDLHARMPGIVEYELSLDQVSRKGASLESPAHLALSEIPLRVRQQEQRISDLEHQMAAEAAFALITGDFTALNESEWRIRQQRLNSEQLQIARLCLESPRRWANGFSCLCFAMIGIPVSIRVKNREFLTSFFLCFLPVLLIYYPLTMFAINRAKSGAASAYIVWLPDIVLSAWSLWMLKKVIRF
jgi:lipopolysaccharide export system permease protein